MEQNHVKSFAEARKNLVERRSALIKSLSFAHQEAQMEAHVDLIIRIQNGLDVIDRAIAEEQIEAGAQPA
jgi:hypothetical protein